MTDDVSHGTPAKPKRIPPRIYVDIRKMIDPETGELVGCLVPAGHVDRAILRRKKIKTGMRIRTTVSKERSYGQHKYAHKIGQFMEANVEGFEGMDAHQVIKVLQLDGGVFCDEQEIDASPVVGAVLKAAGIVLGEAAAKMLAAVLPSIKTIKVKVPRSLSFDEMDEGDFQAFIKGICRHITEKHMPTLSPEQVTDLIDLMPDDPE